MQKKLTAFTLAELLIALAILGVIATFTIPKILSSSGKSQAITSVKSAYAKVDEAIVDTTANAQLIPENKATFLDNRLNYVKKVSDSDSVSYYLHSGVKVIVSWDFGGMGTSQTSADPQPWTLWIIYDWNGDASPNAVTNSSQLSFESDSNQADMFVSYLTYGAGGKNIQVPNSFPAGGWRSHIYNTRNTYGTIFQQK